MLTPPLSSSRPGWPDRTSDMAIHSQPYFHQELAALRKLERILWPNGPVCPHCGATDRIGAVTGKGARPGLKFCCHCRKQFRVTIGTMFEGSHVPLHKWFQACLLLTTPVEGISAHQLHRHLGVTYKTALWMVRRLEPVVSAAAADVRPLDAVPDRHGDGTAPGRRRLRWRRHRSAAARSPETSVIEADEIVPWAYPAAGPEQTFLAFAELARGLGCLEDEAAFDEVLRRTARRVPTAS